ncbi:MAG: hypothetical protein FJ241_03735 [Nitrospira sp.]|nr:hypothetical protein [Nitrospira sp.]
MEEQSRQENRKKVDIEGDIINHFSKVKGLCDSVSALINKGGQSTEDDITKANEITDEIQYALEDIRDLLFELEDNLAGFSGDE